MKPVILLLLLIVLGGCAHTNPRDRFIESLDTVNDQTLWVPPLAAPLPEETWLFYSTPNGTYSYLGDGIIVDPQNRIYVPY